MIGQRSVPALVVCVLSAVLVRGQGIDTSIHAAAARGDVSAVGRILDANPAALTARLGVFQATPLHEAARANQVAVVELLLARGADVNVKDRSLSTPLHAAIRAGAADAARRLIAAGADLRTKDSGGATVLLAAVEKGARSILENLLAKGADANDVDGTGRTALVTAIEGGHEALVEPLIGAGARIEAVDASGKTPLHWAAERGRCEAAAVLLAKGAVVNARDRRSQTPLLLAAGYGHLACVDALLGAKADVNARNAAGLTPLHAAAVGEKQTVADRLVARGAQVDIFAAAALGDLDTLRQIVDADAGSVMARDSVQGTPLHWAATHNRAKAVQLLLERKADVNDTMADGTTPLHLAAQTGATAAVRVLLSGGADPALRTRAGKTADDLAAAAKREDVRTMLREHESAPPKAEPPAAAARPSEPKPAPSSPSAAPPGSAVPALPVFTTFEQLLSEAPRLLDERFLRRAFPVLAAAGRIAGGLSVDEWTKRMTAADRGGLLQQIRGPKSRFFDYTGTDGARYLRWTTGTTVAGDRLVVPPSGVLPPPDVIDAWLDEVARDHVWYKGGFVDEVLKTTWGGHLDAAILARAFDQLKRARRLGSGQQSLTAWTAGLSADLRARLLAAANGAKAAFRWQEYQGRATISYFAEGAHTEFSRLELPAHGTPSATEVDGWISLVALRLVVTCDLAAVLKGQTPARRLDVWPWRDLWDAIEAKATEDVALILHYYDRDLDEANTIGPKGRTALMHAALCEARDIVELLLNAGARVDAFDDAMDTPVHIAAGTYNLDIVRLLVDRGAPFDRGNLRDRTPLHQAAFSGSPAIVRYLLSKGATVNVCDKDNRAALGELELRAKALFLTGDPPLWGTNEDVDEIRKLLLSKGAIARCR